MKEASLRDFDCILWDLDDDPDGNVQHIAKHGLTKEDVEDVFQSPQGTDISRSTGRPVVFGNTRGGRHIIVVYEITDAITAYPITAFDVPQRKRP
jgi:uncharacterized DUF497 family protein